ILAEPENPGLMPNQIEKQEAIKRIEFYAKHLHFFIISDLEIQYLRHYPPDKLNKIQDYYIMSFRRITKNMTQELLEEGKLTVCGYRKIYLNQARIELGIRDEKKLREGSRAADKFLYQLDRLRMNGITIIDENSVVKYIQSLN